MDKMKNLQDRIERLIDSVHDPKDVEELEIVRNQIKTLQSEQLNVQKENRRISAENLDLVSRNKVLHQQIERMKLEASRVPAAVRNSEPDEFVEHLGVLFNRKAGGRFVPTPYCPKCHRAMKAVSDVLPFTCSHCRTTTSFTAAEINDVVVKLQRS